MKSLRALKIENHQTDDLKSTVPKTLEVAYLPPAVEVEDDNNPESSTHSNKQMTKHKFFPGIFLAASPARFVRPVMNLEIGGIEWIGPLEQVNMSIACLEEDIRTDTTH